MLTRSQAVPAKKATSCCGCFGSGSSSKGSSKTTAKESRTDGSGGSGGGGGAGTKNSAVPSNADIRDAGDSRGHNNVDGDNVAPQKGRRSRTSMRSHADDQEREFLL